MPKPKIQHKLATANNPIITAVISGMYSFAKEEQAVEKLGVIRENFTLAKHAVPGEIKIWIKAYELTEDEINDGRTGNFAIITLMQEADRFIIKAAKLPVELKYHPQKKHIKRSRHPNWAHPILRKIKQGKHVYETIELARADLIKLFDEYPETSIPNPDKLFIMIYEKEPEGKGQVVKYILRLKTEAIGVRITYEKNIKESKPKDKQPPKESIGYFTQLVSMKKKRK